MVVYLPVEMLQEMDNDELETTRAPGYRFYPTEEELLMFYLPHKLENTRPDVERVIPVLDVYHHHPRDLQLVAGEGNRSDPEQWFFFCPRQEREEQGGRPTRTTSHGYWKVTGSPAFVFSSSTNRRIGIKRTMVFYEGRAPSGVKTDWKMNEYKALQHDDVPVLRKEFSLCRVYIKTATNRSFDRRPINPICNENCQFAGEALTPDTNVLQPPPQNKSSTCSPSSDDCSSDNLVSNKDALHLSVLDELGFDLDLNWF